MKLSSNPILVPFESLDFDGMFKMNPIDSDSFDLMFRVVSDFENDNLEYFLKDVESGSDKIKDVYVSGSNVYAHYQRWSLWLESRYDRIIGVGYLPNSVSILFSKIGDKMIPFVEYTKVAFGLVPVSEEIDPAKFMRAIDVCNFDLMRHGEFDLMLEGLREAVGLLVYSVKILMRLHKASQGRMVLECQT